MISSGRQISDINSPMLYNYSRASFTTPPTHQSHVANCLQASPIHSTRVSYPSPNSDSYYSQSSLPDSNAYPVSHTSVSDETQSHSCLGCDLSFARASDLQRHFNNIHLQIRHHCVVLGCGNNRGKGYCRGDKLRCHLRQRHKYFATRRKTCGAGP
jgi:hypothetical protein